MSLDIVVWLSCSVSLPAALPNSDEWRHWRASSEQLASMPKELAALLEGVDTWDLNRPRFILRAEYASKEPVTWEHLQKLVPEIEVNVIRAEAPETSKPQSAAERRAQEAFAERVRHAKMGISLVLEGVNDPGMKMQESVASHLARACEGALLETPAGYRELDKFGREVPGRFGAN